jgi:SAM-dependent methyltransferase
MQTKELLQQKLDALRLEHGDWTYDIPLPFDIWTKGNLQIPHTRLKRIVQIIHDLAGKPLNECRVLDLGCLDGIFSIELALHGASTMGIDFRDANIKKAVFCQEALGLKNLEFRQDDARNISLDAYGKFDAIICSGLLYHLPALDAIHLIDNMFNMVERVVVIDTHVSLLPEERILHNGTEYWGDTYREYANDTPAEAIAKLLWASANNPTSFWFTRPSLINILGKAGFSSVFECFYPVHAIPTLENFEHVGITSHDRCTFVAVKDKICKMQTSPAADRTEQIWQENTLSYAPSTSASSIYKNIFSKLWRAKQ